MMSGIRGKNTKPEMAVRRGLHAMGFRYTLHNRKLPGSPDLVLPKYNAVIFVHGCFWHGHDCHLFKWPKTRTEFWREKIGANIQRDEQNYDLLTDDGWRQAIVWECSLRGRAKLEADQVFEKLHVWLSGAATSCEVAGTEATKETKS